MPTQRHKITVSRKTTFLTGPLRPDGCVDYLAATNNYLRQNVSPKTNAAIPLFQVFGPRVIKPEVRERFFNWLGMPAPPEEGEYLLSLEDFDPRFKLPPLEQISKHRNQPFEQACEEWDYVCSGPWTSEEFPHFAACLTANEKPLEIFRLASRLPSLATPRIGMERKVIHNSFAFGFMECRDACYQLVAHAMWRLGLGDVTAAWEDVLAICRWGRLCLQGVFLENWLTGIVVRAIVPKSISLFAFYAKISADQARNYRVQIQDMPPRKSIQEIWDYGERLDLLDELQELAIRGYEPPKEIPGLFPNEEIRELMQEATGQSDSHQMVYRRLTRDSRLDWNEAMRYCNYWFDRVVEAYDQPDFMQRAWALCDLEHEIGERGQEVMQRISGDDADIRELDPETLARNLVEFILGTRMVSWKHTLDLDTESQTRDDFCQICLALAGYRYDHGGYPEELEMLTPNYLQELPNDLYTGEPLHYQPDGEGFLLYAVGPNGRDDGGRHFTGEDWAQAVETSEEFAELPDDIALRVPPKRSRPSNPAVSGMC
ncbi:MAG: hypothetical protein JXB10_16255 [Pirellulales bacterium]|nr:hypothetical protein [Pirellulales bacterium]